MRTLVALAATLVVALASSRHHASAQEEGAGGPQMPQAKLTSLQWNYDFAHRYGLGRANNGDFQGAGMRVQVDF